jgi:DnaJ-class molecular chaperone
MKFCYGCLGSGTYDHYDDANKIITETCPECYGSGWVRNKIKIEQKKINLKPIISALEQHVKSGASWFPRFGGKQK